MQVSLLALPKKNEMLTAITHKPSPHLNDCELTFLSAQEIDFQKAQIQHENYCQMLSKLGADVITLEENLDLPDCAFVEDTAVVLDEVAIITSMGVSSRRRETEAVEKKLAEFRPVKRIELPAQIEGGDVLAIDKNIFVGNSSRTNAEGINDFREIVNPLGYKVFAVDVLSSLHLTTACTALDDETILINPEWIKAEVFKGFRKINLPQSEPFTANILRINNTICIHSEFTETAENLEKLGYKIESINISEFLKAEAGLTCLSLVFENN